jgi:putative aldouronate transport system substrate-binding protein
MDAGLISPPWPSSVSNFGVTKLRPGPADDDVGVPAYQVDQLLVLNAFAEGRAGRRSGQSVCDLLMVTRKLPDIVGGDALKDQFIRGGMEGAFQPLNGLIDQHAPHPKAFLNENPLVAQAITAPDGNIYYIPSVPDGTVSRGWWVRQDWLDKLGLKTPQNVDELYEVLKTFRDRDPNGNGKKDEVPYFNAWEYGVYRLVVLWGARSSGSNTRMDWIVEDGKVVHPFTEERFRFAIKNVAK